MTVKVYLSSYLFGEDVESLRPDSPPKRAGIVFNALDGFAATRLVNRTREFEPLESLGYDCSEVDLRDYFGDQRGLASRLLDVDLLWVVGGNTFVLARAIAQSGLRTALVQAAAERPFTYAGYSAGACVAGPDLEALSLIDDPAELPDGYSSEAPFECLGLIPFRVVPHWQSDHPESKLAALVAERLQQLGLTFQCLRDGDVMTVEAP